MFVSDKYQLKKNHITITSDDYTNSSFSNIGNNVAIIQHSDNGVDWADFINIDPKQQTNAIITKKYIKLITDTVVYVYNQSQEIQTTKNNKDCITKQELQQTLINFKKSLPTTISNVVVTQPDYLTQYLLAKG